MQKLGKETFSDLSQALILYTKYRTRMDRLVTLERDFKKKASCSHTETSIKVLKDPLLDIC